MTAGRGSTTVELVVLAPCLFFCALLVGAAGRYQSANVHIQAAAHGAARSASMAARERMEEAARDSISRVFRSNGLGCRSTDVRTRTVDRGDVEFVVVSVSCRLETSGLVGFLAPRNMAVSAAEVIDVYSFR